MSSSVSSGFSGLFSGFTRLSRVLSFVLALGFTVTYFAPSTVKYFALVPGKTIPLAWNLVTSGFIETTIPGLAANILAVLFLGRILEPVWGSKEFFWFILVVNVWTATATFCFLIALFYVTEKAEYLYSPISGFHGIAAGCLVGVKQLMPDQEIALLYVLKFRAKWLPSIAVLLTIILTSAFGGTTLYLPYILIGTFVSWIYLRFYQSKAAVNGKGDPSEEFAFATFFPEFLRPVVNIIAAIVGRIFCGRRTSVAQSADSDALATPLPGSDPSEAIRRRERGARALEERLNLAKSSDPAVPVSVPSSTETAKEVPRDSPV